MFVFEHCFSQPGEKTEYPVPGGDLGVDGWAVLVMMKMSFGCLAVYSIAFYANARDVTPLLSCSS